MITNADVFYGDVRAGTLSKRDGYYAFQYNPVYLSQSGAKPISLSLPLQKEPFEFTNFPPFFDGLLPEGWLLDLSTSKFKIDRHDKFALLLALGADGIGAVSVKPLENLDAP